MFCLSLHDSFHSLSGYQYCALDQTKKQNLQYIKLIQIQTMHTTYKLIKQRQKEVLMPTKQGSKILKVKKRKVSQSSYMIHQFLKNTDVQSILMLHIFPNFLHKIIIQKIIDLRVRDTAQCQSTCLTCKGLNSVITTTEKRDLCLNLLLPNHFLFQNSQKQPIHSISNNCRHI